MPDLSHPIPSYPIPLGKRNHTAGEPWPCQRGFSAPFSLFASLGSFKWWLLTAHLAIAQRGVAARHRNGAAEWTGTAAWSAAPPRSLARARRGAGIVEEISAVGLESYYVTLCIYIYIYTPITMCNISYILLCIHLHLMGSHGQHADMVVCFLWALNFQAKQALQIDPLKRTDSIIDGVAAQKGNALFANTI